MTLASFGTNIDLLPLVKECLSSFEENKKVLPEFLQFESCILLLMLFNMDKVVALKTLRSQIEEVIYETFVT